MNLNFSELKDGLNDLAINVDYGSPIDNLSDDKAKGNLYIYQQPYSVVIGSSFTTGSGATFIDPDFLDVHFVDDVRGFKTDVAAIDNLAAEGAFTYSGIAFNGKDVGNLTYDVDFAARTFYWFDSIILGVLELFNLTTQVDIFHYIATHLINCLDTRLINHED